MSVIDFASLLKETFDVTITFEQSFVEGEPEFTLEFSQDHSNTITNNLKYLRLDVLKTNAETAAKMIGSANPWQVVRNIKIISINPFEFYVKSDFVFVEFIIRRLLSN